MSKLGPKSKLPFTLRGLVFKGGGIVAALIGVVLWLQLFPMAMNALNITHPWLWVIALPLWLASPIVILWSLTRSDAKSTLKEMWGRRGSLSSESGDRQALLKIARELALTGQKELLIERVVPLMGEVDPDGGARLGEALKSLDDAGWDPAFDVLESLNQETHPKADTPG